MKRTEKPVFDKALGASIQHYRRKAGYTDETLGKLAEKIAAKKSELQFYEAGIYSPSPWRLAFLAEELGVSVDELTADAKAAALKERAKAN